MPEKMGKAFDEDMLKSPLTVGRPKNEPGPEVHNSPVAYPDDPLNVIPGSKGSSRRLGSKGKGY